MSCSSSLSCLYLLLVSSYAPVLKEKVIIHNSKFVQTIPGPAAQTQTTPELHHWSCYEVIWLQLTEEAENSRFASVLFFLKSQIQYFGVSQGPSPLSLCSSNNHDISGRGESQRRLQLPGVRQWELGWDVPAGVKHFTAATESPEHPPCCCCTTY